MKGEKPDAVPFQWTAAGLRRILSLTMRIIDRFLNRFTMYRLALYFLAALLCLGLVYSFFGIVPGGPAAVISTTAVLLAACYLSNLILAAIWKVRANPESSLITALILALIYGPVSIMEDPAQAGIIALAGVVAVASKYLLAFRRQHVFNPAAFGAVFSALVFGAYASWWVGTLEILPLVVIGGFLLARKVGRLRVIGVYLLAYTLLLIAFSLGEGAAPSEIPQIVLDIITRTSVVFFAVVMLTEPKTSPKRFALQAVYAAVAALLCQPQVAPFGRSFSQQEALLVGNLLSFIVSPSFKLKLPLKSQSAIGSQVVSFSFAKPAGFTHRPGQFMEWTVPLTRGGGAGRRWFSIASSPTEPDLMIAIRLTGRPSAYKHALSRMETGGTVIAGDLGGDFVLPKNRGIKLTFIAGGIGITPFRSMLKYLADKGERRDIVLFYSNYREEEIVFPDILRDAETAGLKTIFTLTEAERVRQGWNGRVGFVDAAMIREEAPDFKERLFFVSGSPAMVNAMKGVLRSLGVRRSRIRSDSFTGYST
jgi:ferredoxin-NADP reductase